MSYTKDFDNNLLFRIIYSFHVPLFFFISGYLTSFENNLKVWDLVKQKTKLLIIPLISWWMIYCFLEKACNWNINFLTSLTDIINSPARGLWFFWVLFLCYITTAIAAKLSNKLNFFAFIILFFFIRVLHIHILWYAHFKFYYLFFLVGYLISRYYNILDKKNSYFLVLLILIYPLLFKGWHRIDLSSYSFLKLYGLPFCAILPIFCLFKTIDKVLIKKNIYDLFCKLGLYTFDIYAIHMSVLLWILNIGYGLVSASTYFLIYLFVPIIISKFILRKSPILKLLFLGNHKT